MSVGVDPPLVQAAFRAGLGAQWSFLGDEQRRLIAQIDILDQTEGEYAYRAQPYTFVLRPDLSIHRIYNGGFSSGGPRWGRGTEGAAPGNLGWAGGRRTKA